MNRIVVINGGNTGSTGKIIYGIYDQGIAKDFEFEIFTPPGKKESHDLPDNIFIGSRIERRISDKINYLTGHLDALNIYNTWHLISHIKKSRPNLIHLHNLHGNYINLDKLFRYLKYSETPIIWTLHDCWSFTGQCAHFTIAQCNKWKSKCFHCPCTKNYPSTFRDCSDVLYNKKKRLFNGLKNMTIVTPSRWLAENVKNSFLKSYPLQVIHNGVDLSVFSPTESDFRQKWGIEDRFIILSVAPLWTSSKGIDRLFYIAKRACESFVFVVVGNVEKKINLENIIYIPHTSNQKELIEIYTASDVFLNPTREDTFPTVNLEALACGTPVLSYGACGSAEAFDETCGTVVNDDSVIPLLKRMAKKKPDRISCIRRARQFSAIDKFGEYISLYEKIINTNTQGMR